MSSPDAFQALADPSRREILRLLAGESLTINAIAKNFDMSRPAVSKHVKVLQTTGFISIEDQGRERYCILKEEGFADVQEWINFFDQFWGARLRKLERMLEQKSK
jgi:DNA-binding transcriptional ArsR family regulator